MFDRDLNTPSIAVYKTHAKLLTDGLQKCFYLKKNDKTQENPHGEVLV